MRVTLVLFKRGGSVSMLHPTTPLRVLVVDDSRSDVRLLEEAFKSTGTPTEVSTAGGGEEALEMLHEASRPKPHLVMLDINMPRVSGHDVLCDIKKSDDLRSTIVLMFSSSSSQSDISKAYECFANGYLTKPTDLDDYYEIARKVIDFWTEVATLPVPWHAS
jgi:two-component system, chemotaxis family, response regulator Rcp1